MINQDALVNLFYYYTLFYWKL